MILSSFIMSLFTAVTVNALLSLFALIFVRGDNGPVSPLELVASFTHQASGVAVHPPSGRVFVNFPRWTEDAPVSVAEVLSTNTIVPFPPDSQWNSWRNARKDELDPTKHFICVQSVYAFGNSLFVLDPAAPGMNVIVPNGPKIVEIDLNTNQTKRTILINETFAPQTSYMNDIRISPDGRWAYITDSGVVGALIVVNLETGKVKRVLHGHPTTQADKTVIVKYHGVPIMGPAGNIVEATADGIALSIDGLTLYWQAIRGKNLYSIPTASLQADLSDVELARQIKLIGVNGPADGLWISSRQPNLLYVSSIEDDSIRVRNLMTNTYEVKFTDKRLRWPDTFAEDEEGYIYVTTSRIQDSATFNANGPIPLPTQLWRFPSN